MFYRESTVFTLQPTYILTALFFPPRFYKEELAGETLNYIHSRSRCSSTSSEVYSTLRAVALETSENAQHINRILETQGGKTEEAWNVFKEGYVYVVLSMFANVLLLMNFQQHVPYDTDQVQA